jgi:hypothetical protein
MCFLSTNLSTPLGRGALAATPGDRVTLGRRRTRRPEIRVIEYVVIEFVTGQYVELYPTIQSSFGGSVPSGTRGIIKAVDPRRADGSIYLVEFLAGDFTGEQAWLRAIDLFAA